jgi:FxsC-like protein
MSAGAEPGPVDRMPYFFLSYARTPKRDPTDRDDPDRWVYKLYQDLRADILQMTSAPPEEAGFMDRENRLGVEWSPELTKALASCRVFVPLYSRRYFESDNCGKEWSAFARREVNQNARGQQAVNAIVPALWVNLNQAAMPDVAQSVQYQHADLGPRYSAEGFYGIMKLQQYRADYQRAVHRLAQRIVDVAEATALDAEEPAEYQSLPSAFGPASIKQTAADQLQITVLAHDRSTLPEGRANDYYGSTPHTWRPYSPDYPQPLADYARDLARKCLGYQPLVGIFEADNPGSVSKGRPGPPPGLCLVDPWVTVSPEYQRRLRLLDGLDQSWVSVLVPWNSQDADMAGAEQALRAGLGNALGNKLASVPRQCRMAATGIPTLQEFGHLLAQMTMIMLKRFRQSAPAYPPAGSPIARPRLRMADPVESEVADERA